jgi:hypothetical protein
MNVHKLTCCCTEFLNLHSSENFFDVWCLHLKAGSEQLIHCAIHDCTANDSKPGGVLLADSIRALGSTTCQDLIGRLKSLFVTEDIRIYCGSQFSEIGGSPVSCIYDSTACDFLCAYAH